MKYTNTNAANFARIIHWRLGNAIYIYIKRNTNTNARIIQRRLGNAIYKRLYIADKVISPPPSPCLLHYEYIK